MAIDQGTLAFVLITADIVEAEASLRLRPPRPLHPTRPVDVDCSPSQAAGRNHKGSQDGESLDHHFGPQRGVQDEPYRTSDSCISSGGKLDSSSDCSVPQSPVVVTSRYVAFFSTAFIRRRGST